MWGAGCRNAYARKSDVREDDLVQYPRLREALATPFIARTKTYVCRNGTLISDLYGRAYLARHSADGGVSYVDRTPGSHG